ncbi:fasciclin-like protein [Volvox carteri f. nagariensis]|uniref:Fasciclin-like protein n=1 Tax=Volvox carteri f. nagariensis TaxID=3068 RepID=D8TXV8_VOLCA|nr:fasciclin-like protein [Volvox carteri f. nagariensis]EFJ47712.1 fasciclin-like protein [Volvox carteri f. nagariensis]|eukprot:XP_002951183.1 fasciclin-like protein [Volvox carteri f. nagariensis]
MKDFGAAAKGGLIIVALVASLVTFPVATSAANITATVFSTAGTFLFANALQYAGLAGIFSDSSLNITVFAPSDEAFYSALGMLGLTQAGLAGNAALMAPILLYHVVAPALNTSALSAAGVQRYPNVLGPFRDSGSSLEVDPSDALSIKISSIGTDARIINANVSAGNSTIHVINSVLLPFYPSISAAFVRNPELTTLLGLVAQNAPNLIAERFGPTAELTIFAPKNSAFSTPLTTNSAAMARLLQNPFGVYYILGYHVVPNEVIFNATAATEAGTATVTTLT